MRQIRVRRSAGAVAALVAAAVVLSGCLYGAIGEDDPRAATPLAVPADVNPEFVGFYQQDVTWSGCGGEAGSDYSCTDVRVPLDWNDAKKGELTIRVARHLANNPSPIGSLLINPGGPGSSGVSMVIDSLNFAVGRDLAQAYDVIGFDPRGVGESTAVTCLSDQKMDEFIFGIPPGTRGSTEWNDEVAASQESFADACEQNSDGILQYITTDFAARDMDVIRAIVRDEKLNYLGYSYGTYLGATYANIFPERVGRLVLDGALDPSIPGPMVGAAQAGGFQSAMKAYLADCSTSTQCPFRGTVDQQLNDIKTLLAQVDADPLPNSDGRELGADTMLTAIVSALYSEQSWSYLTDAFTGVLAGDPSTAFLLADFYYSRDPSGTYTDNSTEAFTAYNCMDYPEATEAEQAEAEDLVTSSAPEIAPYWEGPDICDQWPYPPTGKRGPIHASGAAPILVIGTTNDPATPYAWSVALADQLDSGVLITREGEGHTGFNKGNACVDDAVNAYFIDDVVPDADVTCPA